MTTHRAVHPLERLLTREDLATALQVTTRHLSAMVARGELPEPIRFGRLVRWPKSAIDAWIEARTPQSR